MIDHDSRLLGPPRWFFAAMLLASLLSPAAADPGLTEAEVAQERAALLAAMAQSNAPVTVAGERITLPGAAVLGMEGAPVVLVEFGDYQCGFCRRHLMTVMPSLLRDHVETGQLRYVFIEFPAERNRPASLAASNAALCANDQGRYLEMRERIYTHPMNVDADGFLRHAERLELDLERFTDCVEAGTHEALIRQHLALGQRLRVRGTPTFFVGRPGPNDGELLFERRITGAQPLDLFQREIAGLLVE
jgi:protein-disulfide isomerase